MFFLYSIILSIGFLLMLPLFFLRREKYASGFRERLGDYPDFRDDDRQVIWLHCVSVGETNAARPLVDAIREELPTCRLIVSTTTKTGQDLANRIFGDKADAIFYFPFDWNFTVRRALANYKPSLVLLMETEIWPRFIREARLSGSKVAIVNGRLSRRSFERYSRVATFVQRVLADVDVALMQDDADAKRIIDLGMPASKVNVTGNLKFEQSSREEENHLTEEFRTRFGISSQKPLIIAASTHDPEERFVLASLDGELGRTCRLMIAPRHPERFETVEKLIRESHQDKFVRRSSPPSAADKNADIILLDSIGELRAAYPLAEIVFVGGSLIPHGGQSILEPAAEAKAIVTGPHTHNFEAVIRDFLKGEAIRQTPETSDDREISERLHEEFALLLENRDLRHALGRNAAAVLANADRDATAKTVEQLQRLIHSGKNS